MSYLRCRTFFHIESFSSVVYCQILRLDRSVRCIGRTALLEVGGIYYILYQDIRTIAMGLNTQLFWNVSYGAR